MKTLILSLTTAVTALTFAATSLAAADAKNQTPFIRPVQAHHATFYGEIKNAWPFVRPLL
jgi:hypothetical protein